MTNTKTANTQEVEVDIKAEALKMKKSGVTEESEEMQRYKSTQESLKNTMQSLKAKNKGTIVFQSEIFETCAFDLELYVRICELCFF